MLTTRPITPSRLTWARRRRGLDQVKLADSIGTSVRSIKAYESGEFAPGADSLRGIARALRFPERFFLGDTIDDLIPTAIFRAGTKLSARMRDAALGSAAVAIAFNQEIERFFELPEPDFPDLGHRRSPEQAADFLRLKWHVDDGPIESMMQLLESKGVRIFTLPADAAGVSSFSVWHRDRLFVFLSPANSDAERRFDLAHELGHFVLHQDAPAGPKAQRAASAFASAFLMPTAAMRAEGASMTADRLVPLAKAWGVPALAMADRLHKLGLLTEWQYRSFRVEIATKEGRQGSVPGVPQERSELLSRVFARGQRIFDRALLLKEFHRWTGTMSQTISPEALRQLGIAIQAEASRTGATISPEDATLLGTILTSMSGAELDALAKRADAVLGKVGSIIENLAKLKLAEQKEQHARGGPQDAAGEPGAEDKMPRILRDRIDAFLDRLAGRASNERGSGAGSSAAYQRELPGTSISGNGDIRGINLANYYSSPMTRAMVDTGMNYNTFNYLRDQGFGRTNIVNAARDARALGFSANDKPAVRDHAIIDKHDNKPRETNKALKVYQDRLHADEKLADLKRQRDAAKDDETRNALNKQIMERMAEHTKPTGLQGRIADPANHPEAKKATERRKDAIDEKFDPNNKLLKKHGHKAAAEMTEASSAPLSASARRNSEREASETAAAEPTRTGDQRKAKADALFGDPATQPQPTNAPRAAEAQPQQPPPGASTQTKPATQVASATPRKDPKAPPKSTPQGPVVN